MATNQPTTITNNEFQLFDCVATHIANTFDPGRIHNATVHQTYLHHILRCGRDSFHGNITKCHYT